MTNDHELTDWQKLTAEVEATMDHCARLHREIAQWAKRTADRLEIPYWVNRDDEDDVADWRAFERRRAFTVIDGG